MKRAGRILAWIAAWALLTVLIRFAFHAYGDAHGAQAERALLMGAFGIAVFVLVLAGLLKLLKNLRKGGPTL